MEPKIEPPKQYTPKEIAQLEKSRTISDAELLKGGAEYSINEKGEKENLIITDKLSAFLETAKSYTREQHDKRVRGLLERENERFSEAIDYLRGRDDYSRHDRDRSAGQ